MRSRFSRLRPRRRLAGLERHRSEIIPGWQAKGYVTVARFMPGLLRRMASRRANSVTEEAG